MPLILCAVMCVGHYYNLLGQIIIHAIPDSWWFCGELKREAENVLSSSLFS